jgi:amidohydrolase family protein
MSDAPACKLIDAYAHVGAPRFGSAEEALAVGDRWGISNVNLVLGPGVPNLAALRRAQELGGDRVRCFGIPFGGTEAQRNELADVQLRLGIAGMRLMPFEIASNATILDKLGERGLWLFAINPYDSAEVIRALLDWLEKYPHGRIASSHFLRPMRVDQACDDSVLFRELLAHPRFFAILSRHGGTDSREPYPHEDHRPWVEDLVDIMTWRKLMWGSEYPVLYWRNERIDEAIRWIDALGVALSPTDRGKFLGGNAQRLFFDAPAPPAAGIETPPWVAEQWSRQGVVPLFPTQQACFSVPMSLYEKLHSEYVRLIGDHPELKFNDYLVDVLQRHVARDM